DRNTRTYQSASTYYLGNDTIRYSEQQQMDQRPFLTEVNLTAMANEESHYFSNAFTLAYRGERGTSAPTSNDEPIAQPPSSRIRDFSNTLQYTPMLKNGDVISFNWYINHYNQPQTLLLNPGIHADVLNGGTPYAHARQTAETPVWFNYLSADYRITKGAIKQ